MNDANLKECGIQRILIIIKRQVNLVTGEKAFCLKCMCTFRTSEAKILMMYDDNCGKA